MKVQGWFCDGSGMTRRLFEGGSTVIRWWLVDSPEWLGDGLAVAQ